MPRAIGPFSGRLTLFLMLTLSTLVVSGCGGSERETKAGVPGAAKLLNPEDMYRYEGTGAAKKKVLIDHRQRRELLREAGEKLKSQ